MTASTAATNDASGADFPAWLARAQQDTERHLTSILTRRTAHPPLLDAMRYAVLGGGKRLRPALLYATAHPSAPPAATLNMACALELVHCYSLVHDDLPCMDDDAVRRGQPTCHKVYGEAIALLAGDCLQTLAFEVLAADGTPAEAVRLLAVAAGAAGMGGGQALDLHSAATDADALAMMHRLKTGALFVCAVQMGLLTHPAPAPATAQALRAFADSFGLLYQIANDIDGQCRDRAQNKSTFATSDATDAQQSAQEARAQATAALAKVDDSASTFPYLLALCELVYPL